MVAVVPATTNPGRSSHQYNMESPDNVTVKANVVGRVNSLTPANVTNMSNALAKDNKPNFHPLQTMLNVVRRRATIM